MQFQVTILIGLTTGFSNATDSVPHSINLTEWEIESVRLYWKYNAADRVLPFNTDGTTGNSYARLGFKFMVPSTERLAGVTYIGHASRLRLALGRAHNGMGHGGMGWMHLAVSIQHHLALSSALGSRTPSSARCQARKRTARFSMCQNYHYASAHTPGRVAPLCCACCSLRYPIKPPLQDKTRYIVDNECGPMVEIQHIYK